MFIRFGLRSAFPYERTIGVKYVDKYQLLILSSLYTKIMRLFEG